MAAMAMASATGAMSQPQRSEFRFFERLRVRWSEVDLQRIVFNGHYLMYFDTAVAGYWRALAMPYHETMARLDGDLFVRKATVEYLGSARYDDLCDVGMRVARIGNSSMSFIAAVFRGEQLLVHGELVYVFADPATQTSRTVPQALREVLQCFEAGESMFDVRLGSWAELGPQAAALRRAVFMDEQGVPAAMDGDADDADALHAVVLNRFGQALATGRLSVAAPGQGKIARMAVMQAMRGGGLGSAVLRALADAGRQRGLQALTLQAQSSAIAFYRSHGFVSTGAPFDELGITHQAMTLALT